MWITTVICLVCAAIGLWAGQDLLAHFIAFGSLIMGLFGLVML